jgi:DNA-binding MarR family transcriptional regulator
VGLTEDGRTLIDQIAHEFQADSTAMLAGLSPSEQASLSSLASRVVLAYASSQGVDLLTLPQPF